jgi:hypothetical protein
MKHLTSHRQSWFYLGIALASTLLISCGQSRRSKPKEAWLPDTKVVQLPFESYAGIAFNTSKEDAKNIHGCTTYELSFSCKVTTDGKEEQIWLISQQGWSHGADEKELGYFSKEVADTIIERFTIKYGLDYQPSEGQESAFAAGIRKSKTYVFGGGQVAFQIGRSLK